MPDLGLVRGVITLITLVTFAGICWWAYRSGNRARFEKDALLVFSVDEAELRSQTQNSNSRNTESQEVEE